MVEVSDFIKNSVQKVGFRREKSDESKVPTDIDRLIVLPFFGDLRSLFVLSSILLKRYREEIKGSKYFILASWSGYNSLFPYVDEYWGLIDESQLRRFYENGIDFINKSDLFTIYYRNLVEHFRDVTHPKELIKYYNGGLTDEFLKVFKHIKVTQPMIPSQVVLGKDFNRELATSSGYKIFISPTFFVKSWRAGRSQNILTNKDFWVQLTKRLIEARFVPIIWQNKLTHDLSDEFTDKCLYILDSDVSKVMAAMRAVGLVLDVFNGISRLALAARTPFVVCDERSRFVGLKEYEIDDLCGRGTPKSYIFSFSTIINGGNWDENLFRIIISRLNNFLPELSRDQWPNTVENTAIVPYEVVRTRKAKKIGTKLLKFPKN